MHIVKTFFQDVHLIKLQKFVDKRGYLVESYNKSNLDKLIKKKINFIQDNHSFSKKNVFRGLHFQSGKFAQNKLVRIIEGKVIDIIVNINPKSKFFMKYKFIELDSRKEQILFIPKTYAHGFYVKSKFVNFLYKVDKKRSISHERVINYLDETINLKWPKNFKPILNKKDIDTKLDFYDVIR